MALFPWWHLNSSSNKCFNCKGFQIFAIENSALPRHPRNLWRNVAFNANGNGIFSPPNYSILQIYGNCLCKRTITCALLICLKSPIHFLLLKKMNYTRRPELAIYLGICASNTSITEVILVFKTKICTFDLWMILTICHLSLLTSLLVGFFPSLKAPVRRPAPLIVFFIRHIACPLRPTLVGET